MKIAVVLLSTFVATLAFPGDSLHSQFAKFKLDHGKQYSSLEELEHRMKVFQSNVEKIEKHNAEAKMGLHSYTMAINQFTDMTLEEFQATLTFKPMSKEGLPLHKSSLSAGDLPDTVDWIKKGYVTDVKDQGECGSDWAFSATGAMEGAFVKKGKKLMTLAPQLLVDCDHQSAGCEGGSIFTGFEYAQSHGVMLEKDYPYVALNDTCQWDESKSQGKMTDFTYVLPNEDALKEALAEVGPISIGLDVGHIIHYGGGILNDCWCNYPSHSFLLVGYGTEGGEDYWLIKNSWGKTWGEDGYFKLARGSNQCCIGDSSLYPTAA